MLNIGIIGYGFVGKAMHNTFSNNTHAVIVDPKYSSSTISDIVDSNAKIIFVCLPAPTLDDGTVDSSLINATFEQLETAECRGIVVLKSTLPPDDVAELGKRFGDNIMFVYSPEFLTEALWDYDSLKPSMVILSGNFTNCAALEEFYSGQHSAIISSPRYAYLTYREAALVKYSINAFLATKVVFMNQLKQLHTDICPDDGPEQFGVWPNWSLFVHALTSDPRVGQSHTLVPGNDDRPGYGGSCFPKDMKAMIGFDEHHRMTVIQEAELANTKLRLG